MNKANKRAAKQARYNEKKRLEKERQTKSTNRKRKQRIYKSLQRKKLNQQQNGTKNDSETNSNNVESGSTGTKRDSGTKIHDVENDVESEILQNIQDVNHNCPSAPDFPDQIEKHSSLIEGSSDKKKKKKRKRLCSRLTD